MEKKTQPDFALESENCNDFMHLFLTRKNIQKKFVLIVQFPRSIIDRGRSNEPDGFSPTKRGSQANSGIGLRRFRSLDFSVSRRPYFVLIGDFNEDGQKDIAPMGRGGGKQRVPTDNRVMQNKGGMRK